MERAMTDSNLSASLVMLLSELVDGTRPTGGYMLNRGDPGILRSLDRLTAAEASAIASDGSSIAAHVDHVMFGISLMNRWAGGERNPWKNADWKASWKRTTVDENGWADLREHFANELRTWLEAIRKPREMTETELSGVISSIAHLAYHLGAIRQMDRKIRGPSANNEVDAFTAPASRL